MSPSRSVKPDVASTRIKSENVPSGRRTRFEVSKPKGEVILSPSPVVPTTQSTPLSQFSFSQFVANFNAEKDEEPIVDESISKKEVNAFESGFSAIESTTPRDETVGKKGITKFEARFKSTKQPGTEEPTTPTENPFAAAINALKTSIFQTEVPTTSTVDFMNEIVNSKEQQQNEITPFRFPTTQTESYNTIDATTTEEGPKIVGSTNSDNERLLNAFEDFFETLTSESPLAESSTQSILRFTESTSASHTENPLTFESLTTQSDANSPTESTIQSDFSQIKEEDNMISEDENYNQLESVDSVVRDNDNNVQSASDKIFDSTSQLFDEVTTESFDSSIFSPTSSQDVDSVITTVKDDQFLLVKSVDPIIASTELPYENNIPVDVIRAEEVPVVSTGPSVTPEVLPTESILRLDDLFDNSIAREGKDIDFNGAVEGNLELTGPKKNLATKIMSNGVRVIVAGKVIFVTLRYEFGFMCLKYCIT